MSDTHISKMVERMTQQEVGTLMGVTQGAVNQMLKSGRDIYFREVEGGRFEFYEIKRPKQKKAA